MINPEYRQIVLTVEQTWLALICTTPVLAMAFSIAIRKLIGARDRWTCQEPGCTKSHAGGWLVHAAHKPEHHHKTDPLYDTEEAGDIRCIEHHLQQHIRGTSLGKHGDQYAVEKLETTDHRTRSWREQHEHS